MPASSLADVSESVPLGLQIPMTGQHSHKIEERVHLRALQMRASHLRSPLLDASPHCVSNGAGNMTRRLL